MNINELNKKIEDNVYLSYFKTIWDKYKFIIIFIIIIVLITFIEIKIATCSSDYSYMLDFNNIMIIRLPIKKQQEENIYIYNINKFEDQTVYDKIGIDKNSYQTIIITQHISDQINKPIRYIKNGFREIFTGPTPINTLTNSVVNSHKLKDLVNPCNSFNDFSSEWRLIVPKNIHFNCFVSNNILYISL